MRVVVAPDKLTGSLTAVEAAEAIGEGLRRGRPGVADGYDGVTTTVAGPTGNG